MSFKKLRSHTEVEIDEESTESDIAEIYEESDNLSVATDSSDDSEQYNQNSENILLSKDGKYNWVDIILFVYPNTNRKS